MALVWGGLTARVEIAHRDVRREGGAGVLEEVVGCAYRCAVGGTESFGWIVCLLIIRKTERVL
jgi:hypothetical protein